MKKMDRLTAESIFNKIIESKRKLTVRNWDSDLFKDDKEEVLKLIELGVITWNESKKQISYKLEEPIGEIELVEFIKRDSIKMRQEVLKDAKTDEDKGINMVCAYSQLKRHQYIELSSSDESYITMIFQLFLA